MYLDSLEFLDEEREAWRPFEALAELDDAALTTPIAAAHGWSGRQLMGHLVACQGFALEAAKELAVNETSPTVVRITADWDTRGEDVVNAEIDATWGAAAIDELRERFRIVPGELRGYLTVVPESRWLKNPDHLRFVTGHTITHYEDHVADLAAVLDAAGR